MPGRLSGDALRRVEMIRELLGLSPAEFARAMGLEPRRYTKILREGVIPPLIANAAYGMAAKREAQVDHAFLVRLTEGIPSIVMLRELRTANIDGRLYLLLPLATTEGHVELPPSPVPVLAGGSSRHQQIIDRVVALLGEHPDGMRPIELLGYLELEGSWFNTDSHAQRLQYLNGILWHECRRGGRVQRPHRGWYVLAQSLPQSKECRG
jgi:transcriptional regulator with XRE-family HTH domain